MIQYRKLHLYLPYSHRLCLSLLWILVCSDLVAGSNTALSAKSNSSALIVIYPRPETKSDTRAEYPTLLLRHALEKTGASFVLVPSEERMFQGRALRSLHEGNTVSVVWSMTSKERELQFRPIRIPIFKGLIGWRLLLIRKESQPVFSNIQSLAGLQPLIAGQGHDWPDTKILQDNDISVTSPSDYEALFRLLNKGRVSFIPRSIVEIWDEERRYKTMGLSVEKTLLLRYPSAAYYFVAKDNEMLAKLIQKGLELSIEDGSFDKLFYTHHQTAIDLANIQNRKIFDLHNLELPFNTPLHREELWHREPKVETKKHNE